MRVLIVTILLALFPAQALAQSACSYLYQGAILTPAQWVFCFQQKQDALNFSPVNKAGDTMNGRLVMTAPTTISAGLNLTPGTSPTSPANGDLWPTSLGLFAQIGGATYQLTKPSATIEFGAIGVNFNATGDNAVSIVLPPGYTRYVVQFVRISNASHSLSTATAGLFTSTGGTGTAIVTGASAITVTSTADAANNNTQSMTVNNRDTASYTAATYATLYFHIGTAEGVAATGDVTVTITPLP